MNLDRFGNCNFWWEKFFIVELANYSINGRKPLLLINREKGHIVGQADNYQDLNARACFILDRIFEEIVLRGE